MKTAEETALEWLQKGVRCDHVMNMPKSTDRAYAFRVPFSVQPFANRITADRLAVAEVVREACAEAAEVWPDGQPAADSIRALDLAKLLEEA